MPHVGQVQYACPMADSNRLRSQFGEAVKRRRDALRLSLRRASKPGVVSHSSIGHIETGFVNATVDMLAEVASVLGARWEVRLVGDSDPARSEVRQELLRRLDAVIDTLDERDVRHLLRVVQAYEADLGAQNQSRT